jgi:hypothetical protein
MGDEVDSPISTPVTPNVYCGRCDSPLVQATDWEEKDESSWHVNLWCPECGSVQEMTLHGTGLVCLSLAIEEGFVWMFDALAELHTLSDAPDALDLTHRARTDRIESAGK